MASADQYGTRLPEGAIARLGTVRAGAKEGDRVASIAFAPDGKTLASGGEDGSVRRWDLATWKELHRYGEHPKQVGAIAFSPDGKVLVSASHDGTIAVWDVAGGRELGNFQSPRGVVAFEFSADGKVLLGVCNDEMYRAWDVPTGEAFGEEPTNLGPIRAIGFSPEGDTVVIGGWESIARLCERESGQELRQFQGHRASLQSAAFAPDGRTVATGSPDETIRLWEVRTGKERLQIVDQKDGLQALAFAPDGRTLASAGHDTTVLVWDLTGRSTVKGPARLMQLAPSQLEAIWQELGSLDVPTAYRAIWAVATNAKLMVPFVKNKVKMIVPVDRQRIQTILGDLGHDVVARRDKATAELEKVGSLCEPLLAAALQKPPSMDTRRRLEKLLDKARGPNPSPDALYVLRVLEALELANTSEARLAMEGLTKETPPTRITAAAKAALARMKRRPVMTA